MWEHCSVPSFAPRIPAVGMSCWTQRQRAENQGKERRENGRGLTIDVWGCHNLLNAARLLLFLISQVNSTGLFYFHRTLTAVRSAHHNSLSGHSLVAVRGWILGHRVCFTCLIYLKNTPAYSKWAIFFILQQNKSKVHLKSSVSAFSESQIQLCMIADW